MRFLQALTDGGVRNNGHIGRRDNETQLYTIEFERSYDSLRTQ